MPQQAAALVNATQGSPFFGALGQQEDAAFAR
jgi:hypothetical protein